MKKGKNFAELEIELFCKGARIDEAVDLKQYISQRTRAGLGSGIDIILPDKRKKRYLNVPVVESFAKESPFRISKDENGFIIFDDREEGLKYEIEIPPIPDWYFEKTSSGKLMSRIGVLQGTYLGVYIGEVCNFWRVTPKVACKFCTTGVNVGKAEDLEKRVEDVVEVALRAKEESKITFIHFNSGEQERGGLETAAPYVKAIKERVGLLVGVQVTPSKDLWKYDWLIDLGVDHFSFCYEFHNREYFEKYCPGKAQTYGQKAFFDAMEYVSKKMGKGRNSGEIIAGIEPIEDTLKAIDFITERGCFPTICIFRPLIGSELENYPSPRYEDMLIVMRYMYEACMKNGIPIGMAPNIEVSLIVNPDDAVELSPPSLKKSIYELKRAIIKRVAYPLFLYKMRKRRIDVDAFNPSSYKK